MMESNLFQNIKTLLEIERLDVLVTDEKNNAFYKHSFKRNNIFYIVTH